MTEVEASWQAGYTGLPAALTGGTPVLGHWRSSAVQDALSDLESHRQVPAVIYLHGCTGFGAEGNAYRHFLSLQGYAFFAPDSLARPERLQNCDPDRHEAGLRGSAGPLRLAELQYAMAQVAALPWIDSARIFLIGFSEGAAAAARYDGDVFAGVVLTAWHCHGGPDNHGLALPVPLPILAIVSARDPWYPGLGDRTCGLFMNNRPLARNVVLPQQTHVLLTAADSAVARTSREAILKFLSDAGAARRHRHTSLED